MFDKFGEFDSFMEINMAAESLLEEGDLDSLKELAKENGLQDYVEDYINEGSDELCNPITAAIGKIEVERADAKAWKPLADDIADYLEGNCDDIDFALQVRKKGKRMENIAETIVKNAKTASKSISLGNIRCSYYGPAQMYEQIKEYYKGE